MRRSVNVQLNAQQQQIQRDGGGSGRRKSMTSGRCLLDDHNNNVRLILYLLHIGRMILMFPIKSIRHQFTVYFQLSVTWFRFRLSVDGVFWMFYVLNVATVV